MKNKDKKKDKIEKEDNHIIRSCNKTLLLYHIVFPVKYRKELLAEDV
jgi:REP element-mobilizing transposase RayT